MPPAHGIAQRNFTNALDLDACCQFSHIIVANLRKGRRKARATFLRKLGYIAWPWTDPEYEGLRADLSVAPAGYMANLRELKHVPLITAAAAATKARDSC